MNWNILPRRTGLNLIGALILAISLGSAALIYHQAGPEPYGAMGYEIADGTDYPLMPQDSKIYRYNLELYGGKLNVMMDDFNRWFLGLWRGKSLAVIVAGLGILVSLGFFYGAQHLAPSPPTGRETPESDKEG